MSQPIQSLKPPKNRDLPFFAYGIFKPNQIAYSQIKSYVKTYYESEIPYRMLMRDGVPLIKSQNDNQHKTLGYLIYFNEESSKKAYEIISETEPEKLYKWKEIKIGENKANREWKGMRDFDGFFKLQMSYMLLWSSIERYCSLKYNNKGSKINKLSKEKIFEEKLKKYVTHERKVYSAEDLREYTLSPEEPYESIRYYYTIRCNVVHKGKAMYNDEKMLRQSLKELLCIFKELLDETFEEK